MALILRSMECCAATEIDALRLYGGRPVEALKSFCRQFEVPVFAGGKSWGQKIGTKLEDIGAFYVFTGVTSDESGKITELSYAFQFFAYLKANKLGRVFVGPARKNRANHPDHTVRIYIWTPNPRALNLWWKANKVAV